MKAAGSESIEPSAPCIVVMGVSGCGKSTVGQLVAAALRLPYVEGDAFHPPRNVERMRAGIALTDEDREGWLQTLADRLAEARRSGQGAVLACSALKRRYRDRLRSGAPDLQLVYLRGSREQLAARLAARQGHYMPPSLLDSQLATLEPPQADEAPLVCDVDAEAQAIARDILLRLEATHG